MTCPHEDPLNHTSIFCVSVVLSHGEARQSYEFVPLLSLHTTIPNSVILEWTSLRLDTAYVGRDHLPHCTESPDFRLMVHSGDNNSSESLLSSVLCNYSPLSANVNDPLAYSKILHNPAASPSSFMENIESTARSLFIQIFQYPARPVVCSCGVCPCLSNHLCDPADNPQK